MFPHGNLKTDTLYGRFKDFGVCLDETLVYETIPNPNLSQEFNEATSNFTALPEYVVFFSPSGIQSTLKFIQMVDVDLALIKVYN